MSEFWFLFLCGLGLNLVIMLATWWWAVRINNFGIVDAVWSLSFASTTALYATLGTGWIQRRLLLLVIVGFWSLRLGLFLARRIYRHHPKEDVRYKEIRGQYGKNFRLRFLAFFEMQGLSVSILSVPFLWIALNPSHEHSIWELIGLIVIKLGVWGEGIADFQKYQFRQQYPRSNCEVGLWRYSRHPNYFFESIIWWGFWILAVDSPNGATSIFAPLIMLLLLTKVTGVPLSEKHSLASCGDAYRDYQKRVSIFVPWFRKEKTKS